ncbi:MAG: phosphotransferase [Gammaproteobacteria bacterium]
MPEFSSPYFPLLPRRTDLVAEAERLVQGQIEDITLFKFASCNPVFRVEFVSNDGARQRIVLRGEQQNGLLIIPEQTCRLEKEIFTLRQIRSLGLKAPEVLFDGRILVVPALDRGRGTETELRFFAMSYVEGAAIDNKVKASLPDEQVSYLDRIAEIYARLHSLKGDEYGFTDATGMVVDGSREIEGYLRAAFSRKRDLLAEFVDSEVAGLVDAFAQRSLSGLCADLRDDGYDPGPRFVLYDSSHGNMLASDAGISVIDVTMAGYLDAVTGFCSFVFSFRDFLLKTYGDGRFWDHFVARYRHHGGQAPSAGLLWRLLHVLLTDLVLHSVIYCATHHGPDKRRKMPDYLRVAHNLISLADPDMEKVIAALDA